MKNIENENNGMFKYSVHNKVWTKDRSHMYDKCVYDKMIKGSKEEVLEEISKSYDYLREGGWIRLDCILPEKKTAINLNGNNESSSLKKEVPQEELNNSTVGGIKNLDIRCYNEAFAQKISEELLRKGKTEIENLLIKSETFRDRSDRIKIDPSNNDYVFAICLAWDNLNKKIIEENLSTKEIYEQSLLCLDNFYQEKTGNPPVVKIGNDNEGSPYKVLLHLVRTLCNAYYTTDMIQNILQNEEGSVRFIYGFKRNATGSIVPVNLDKYSMTFMKARLVELGIDNLFSFKRGKLSVRK